MNEYDPKHPINSRTVNYRDGFGDGILVGALIGMVVTLLVVFTS